MMFKGFQKPALVIGQWFLFCFAQIIITGLLWMGFMFFGALTTGVILVSSGVPVKEENDLSIWCMFPFMVVCYAVIWSFIWWLSNNSSNFYGRLIAATIPLIAVCALFRPTPSSDLSNSMTLVDIPDPFYYACSVTCTVMFVFLSCVLRHLLRIKKTWAAIQWGALMAGFGTLVFLSAYRLEPILYFHV